MVYVRPPTKLFSKLPAITTRSERKRIAITDAITRGYRLPAGATRDIRWYVKETPVHYLPVGDVKATANGTLLYEYILHKIKTRIPGSKPIHLITFGEVLGENWLSFIQKNKIRPEEFQLTIASMSKPKMTTSEKEALRRQGIEWVTGPLGSMWNNNQMQRRIKTAGNAHIVVISNSGFLENAATHEGAFNLLIRGGRIFTNSIGAESEEHVELEKLDRQNKLRYERSQRSNLTIITKGKQRLTEEFKLANSAMSKSSTSYDGGSHAEFYE